MAKRSILSLLVLAAIAAAQQLPAPTPKNPPLFKGDKNKKDDGSRVLRGVVRDPADNLAEGVVVKLKDTKSLTIRSFITKADGAYHFQGLSAGTDYELRAEKSDGAVSSTKTLSVFDTRREPVINLKLEAKK
ncbi:MAG: carboxypeptidase-like regulatory domain-containing protein [Bryobacter sp.]|jgi:hypothetical protein|nr:carboxypeptidase-like regulatory domain-containing protein [Bryobacter sp. CoA8 C33]